MFEQLLVLSSAADVRERFLRMLAGLDEASAAADAGTRTVLQTYRGRVSELLVEQQGILADHIEGLRAGFGDQPSEWPPGELGEMSAATVAMFDLLSIQHYEVATHLPGRSAAREDLLYLLMRSMRFSLMSREHTRLLSVQESRMLTWEATRFTQLQADGPSAAAIAVPWLETLTPLRWPLAVHELGHYFLPDAALVYPNVLRIAQDHGWREADLTSFKEIVADAIAQGALGDAYAYALAREGYLLSYKTHQGGGVSVADRLRLLGGPIALIDNLPSVWRLDERSPVPTSGSKPPAPPPDPTEEDERAKMRAEALKLVGEPSTNDPERVAEARQLISRGEPPTAVLSSRARSVDGLMGLVEALDEAHQSPVSRLTPEQVGDLTNLAVHRPLTDGEILEAAWLEDCERDPTQLLDSLCGALDDKTIHEAMRDVVERDTWLARALQSAAVHRWVDDGERLDAQQRVAVGQELA
ncbi:MAG: hypothetical protein JWR52_949 [Marmoricola sp.]|nr:hypothetical protein [Marmoricola sp.]